MKIGILTSSSLSEFRLKTLQPILADKEFAIKVAIIDKRPKKSLKQKILSVVVVDTFSLWLLKVSFQKNKKALE